MPCHNGFINNKINDTRTLANTHLSMNGYSVIVDYEFTLHAYYNVDIYKSQGLVPVEVYPYQGDIDLFFVHTDNHFGKADVVEIFNHINAYEE